MAFGQKVPKRFGAPTPSEREDMTDRAREAWARAVRRYEVAKLIASVPGSIRAKRKAVVHAINADTLPRGCGIPSRGTVTNYLKRWSGGDRSPEDYLDLPRPGRPRKILPTAVENAIQLEILNGASTAAGVLHAVEADLNGEDGGDLNSTQVSRRYRDAGRFPRTVYQFGSRAGAVHATPHGRYVTSRTHEVWAIDELTLPVYHRHLDDVTNEWISVRADVVLIMDVRSSAVVGYHVADPTRTRRPDQETTKQGFAKSDVLAALVTAACPELAPDSTRDFAGFVPEKVRWDNAKAHIGIEQWFKEAGVGIDSKRIPKRWANKNGGVERRVGILKRWCERIHGHVDRYLPLDRSGGMDAEALGRERSLYAGSGNDLQSRRELIRPEDLLDLDQVRRVFDSVVHRYNHQHVNRMTRHTAANQYKRFLEPNRPRNGTILINRLETRTVLVSKGAIRHYTDGRTIEFNAIFGGSIRMVDEPVTYLADPLGRAIFVRQDGRLHVLKPALSEVNNALAEKSAKSISALARRLSDQADATRQSGAVRPNPETRQPAETQAQGGKSHSTPPVSIPTPVHRPGSRRTDPWSSGDVTRFLRPKHRRDSQKED